MPEAKGSDFSTKPESMPGRTPKRPHLAETLQKRAEERQKPSPHI